MNTKLCIILVNYNGFADTVACIASILKSDRNDYKIIVVDNGSTVSVEESTLAYIKRNAIYLETGVNLGFAGGNNYGAIYAKNRFNPDLLLFLNNDTEIRKDCLSKLIASIDTEGGPALVTGKILYFDEKDIIWCAGGKIDLEKMETPLLGKGKKDGAEFSERKRVEFATGCVWLVRSAVFFELGMMPESLFLYYEDTGFCIKLQQAGYFILYEPNAVIYHKESRSTQKGSWLYQYYNQRNYLYMVKYYGTNKSKAYMGRLIKCAKELIRGRRNWTATITATIDFLRGKMGRKDRR